MGHVRSRFSTHLPSHTPLHPLKIPPNSFTSRTLPITPTPSNVCAGFRVSPSKQGFSDMGGRGVSLTQSVPIWETKLPIQSALAVTSLSRLRPLIHPRVNRLVPQASVLRLQYPVPFVREVQHFRRNLEPLQRGEQLEALGDVEAIVELAVDYEKWCFEVSRREMWRPLA